MRIFDTEQQARNFIAELEKVLKEWREMSVGDPEFEIKTKQLKDMDPDFPTHLSGGYIYVPVLYGE